MPKPVLSAMHRWVAAGQHSPLQKPADPVGPADPEGPAEQHPHQLIADCSAAPQRVSVADIADVAALAQMRHPLSAAQQISLFSCNVGR